MGTRSGDIDPAIIEFIAHKEGKSIDEVMSPRLFGKRRNGSFRENRIFSPCISHNIHRAVHTDEKIK